LEISFEIDFFEIMLKFLIFMANVTDHGIDLSGWDELMFAVFLVVVLAAAAKADCCCFVAGDVAAVFVDYAVVGVA
jgi:hypothetical protein